MDFTNVLGIRTQEDSLLEDDDSLALVSTSDVPMLKVEVTEKLASPNHENLITNDALVVV